MPRTRLLIADSTALFRGLLTEFFGRQADIEIVADAANGMQAIEMAQTLRPTVAVLSLELAGINGADAIRQMRQQSPTLGVVLLTAQPHLVSLGALCGASQCLPASCSPTELLDAVRRAAQPAPQVAACTASSGRAEVVARLCQQGRLSDREHAVVEKMVLSELTMAQIARTLSRDTGTLFTESAVKHALERALSKMNIEPRTRTALLRRVLDASTHETLWENQTVSPAL